jgi:hypothetical protein
VPRSNALRADFWALVAVRCVFVQQSELISCQRRPTASNGPCACLPDLKAHGKYP